MKNKILIIVLSTSVIVLGVVLAIIIFSTGEAVELDAPMVELIEDTAVWSENENAEKFEVSINGELSYLESNITSYKLTPGQSFKVRAVGDVVNYKTSKWSNLVEYKPTSDKEYYTITWMNGTEILEVDENVPYGSIPSYDGELPQKGSTNQYSYEFSGWNPTISIVGGDMVYYAQFSETLIYYTVTFFDSDNKTVLKTEKVGYGESATPPSKIVKDDLVLVGWKNDFSYITGDLDVYPIFSEACEVKFFMPDGKTQIGETQIVGKYESAEEPNYPEYCQFEDSKTKTTYLKAFSGWDKQFSMVTGDLSITAKYERNTGVVIFVDVVQGDDAKINLNFNVFSDYCYEGNYKKLYGLEMLISCDTNNNGNIVFEELIVNSAGILGSNNSNKTEDVIEYVFNNNEKTFNFAWFNSTGENVSYLGNMMTVKCSISGGGLDLVINALKMLECSAVIESDITGELETVEAALFFRNAK